jgi:hypothetical protein
MTPAPSSPKECEACVADSTLAPIAGDPEMYYCAHHALIAALRERVGAWEPVLRDAKDELTEVLLGGFGDDNERNRWELLKAEIEALLRGFGADGEGRA